MQLETLEVGSANEWRSWLQKNHRKRREIWLVFYKGGFKGSSIPYGEALDEALAFGWIDSLIRKVDEKRYARKFTPRRPGSIWSSLNVDRVVQLTIEGRMTRWGLEAFAKRTGKISLAEKVKAAGIDTPADLESALRMNKAAWNNFQEFTPSYRKRYAMWITAAKTSETRNKRIKEAVSLIAQNVKNLLK